MFNVEILNNAITSLTSEGRAEIQKMVDIFEQYKQDVQTLTEQAEAFEQLSINLQRDKDALEKTIQEMEREKARQVKGE